MVREGARREEDVEVGMFQKRAVERIMEIFVNTKNSTQS